MPLVTAYKNVVTAVGRLYKKYGHAINRSGKRASCWQPGLGANRPSPCGGGKARVRMALS
jgi:hypothetical protein